VLQWLIHPFLCFSPHSVNYSEVTKVHFTKVLKLVQHRCSILPVDISSRHNASLAVLLMLAEPTIQYIATCPHTYTQFEWVPVETTYCSLSMYSIENYMNVSLKYFCTCYCGSIIGYFNTSSFICICCQIFVAGQ
jgi:hypothetical protein